MYILSFNVKGKPQGKERARTFYNARAGKMQSITPEKTKDYEELIAWSYRAAGGKYLGERLIEVRIEAYYEIPKSTSQKRRSEIWKFNITPTTKPDCDNIIKVVLDALNGIAYKDDKQVVFVSCGKHYADNEGFINITVCTRDE